MSAAVNSDRLGVRVIPAGPAAVATRATCAPAPGPALLDATGRPVCAWTRTPPAGLVPVAVVGPPAESHASACGAVKTARPVRSRAVRLPAASAVTVTPVVAVVSLRVVSAGSVAAARVWTTSTSEKPPYGSAVTWRSTSGSTPGYVAVGPDRVGAGRVIGNDSASDRPATVIFASGPAPPPERVRSLVVTVGVTVPSAVRLSPGSSATQEPPTRLRTGRALRVRVRVPVGLATTVSVAVVEPSTGTAVPVDRARASACAVVSWVAAGRAAAPVGTGPVRTVADADAVATTTQRPVSVARAGMTTVRRIGRRQLDP